MIFKSPTSLSPTKIKKEVTFGCKSNLEKKKPIPSLAEMRKRLLRKNSSQIFSVKVERCLPFYALKIDFLVVKPLEDSEYSSYRTYKLWRVSNWKDLWWIHQGKIDLKKPHKYIKLFCQFFEGRIVKVKNGFHRAWKWGEPVTDTNSYSACYFKPSISVSIGSSKAESGTSSASDLLRRDSNTDNEICKFQP